MPGTSFSTGSWTGYDEQSVTNPGSTLTDFTLLIDISNLSSDWKSNVQSDGADIRLTKGDDTELAYDLIDWAYNAGSPTGWIRVKWSGTLAASGTQNVRVWAGYTGGTATAYGNTETYGSDNAYDANWEAYWTSTSVSDRTGNGNNITNTTGVGTIADAKVGDGAFDYTRSSGDYMQMSSAVVSSYPFTMMCWAKTENFPASGAVGLMTIETNGSNDHRHTLYTGTTSSKKVGANSRSTSAGNAVSSTTMSTGTWYHLSGVWSSAASRTARTNAGGAVEDTTSISPSGMDYTRLGRFNNSPVYYFDGILNDTQIHSAARSADWITEEYNQSNDNTTFWGTWAWNTPASAITAGLTDGLEGGSGFAGVNILRVSVGEQVDFSDLKQSLTSLVSQMVDSELLGDTNTNTLQVLDSLVNGSVSGETQISRLLNTGSTVDVFELSDGYSKKITTSSSSSDSDKLGDSHSIINMQQAGITNLNVLGDTNTEVLTCRGSVAEGHNFGDSYTNTLTGVVVFTEGYALGETIAYVSQSTATPYLTSTILLNRRGAAFVSHSCPLLTRRDVAFKMRGVPITYNKFTSKSLNTETGVYSTTTTDTAISECLLGEIDLELVANSGGKYKVGDRAFRVKAENLPEDPPNLKSQITYNSNSYKIVGYDGSRDQNVYVIYGREI